MIGQVPKIEAGQQLELRSQVEKEVQLVVPMDK